MGADKWYNMEPFRLAFVDEFGEDLEAPSVSTSTLISCRCLAEEHGAGELAQRLLLLWS